MTLKPCTLIVWLIYIVGTTNNTLLVNIHEQGKLLQQAMQNNVIQA